MVGLGVTPAKTKVPSKDRKTGWEVNTGAPSQERTSKKKAKGFRRDKMKFGVGVVSIRPWMRLGKTPIGE